MPSNQNPVYTDSSLTGDGTVENPLHAESTATAPGGADGDVQFNSSGVFGNANSVSSSAFAGLDRSTGDFNLSVTGNMQFAVPANKFISMSAPGGEILINSSLVGINSSFNAGNVQIGNSAANNIALVGGNVNIDSLPVFANNAAAVGGGLSTGGVYRTGSDPDTICVVH